MRNQSKVNAFSPCFPASSRFSRAFLNQALLCALLALPLACDPQGAQSGPEPSPAVATASDAGGDTVTEPDPTVDAGSTEPDPTVDAGQVQLDAGSAVDAGQTQQDAGSVVDAGRTQQDAGSAVDGGQTQQDAGSVVDGGQTQQDAGSVVDGGQTQQDAGSAGDAGQTQQDAGSAVDGGQTQQDAGPGSTVCEVPLITPPNLTVNQNGRMHVVTGFPMGPDVIDRTLRIYLPPSYASSPDRDYPVLYMHDGQNLFDPADAAFGAAWEVDATLDALEGQGAVPEWIVVGVDNTSERMSDYTPDVDATNGGGNGDAYLQALIDRVKPWVEANYRVRCGAQNTALIGSSLGGLISFYAYETHGDVFGRFGCVSSSFWWNNASTAARYEQETPLMPVRLWIDGGGSEGDVLADGLSSVLRDNRTLLTRARILGLHDGETLANLEVPLAIHNEAAWQARLPAILAFVLTDARVVPEQADSLDVVAWRPSMQGGEKSAVSVTSHQGPLAFTWPAQSGVSMQVLGNAVGADVEQATALAPGGAMLVANVGSVSSSTVVQVEDPLENIVGFEVTTTGNPSGPLWVAGSTLELGNWVADGIALTEGVDGRWRGFAMLEQGFAYEYKYTRGTWDTVEKDANGAEIANRFGFADVPTMHFDAIARWADQ